MNTTDMIGSTAAWLAGWKAYEEGEGCPWGDPNLRLGWIAARDENEAAQLIECPTCSTVNAVQRRRCFTCGDPLHAVTS